MLTVRPTRWVALGAALVLLLGACGSSGDDDDTAAPTETGGDGPAEQASEEQLDEFVEIDEVGVTDTEIRATVITSATNPLGGKYKEFGDGVEAYFDMVNTEDGGIYGRQLTVAKQRDDQLARNQAEVQAAIAEDNAFAVFIATLLFTGAGDLEAERVPTFGWNINPEWQGPDHFFPNVGALCFGCTGKHLPWIARELELTNIGVMGYGVSEQSKLCVEGVVKTFEQYGDDVGGAEVVFSDDTIGFGVTDLSAQVAQMKDAGVELVTTCMDIGGVFTLAREMEKQQLDAIQIMPNGYDLDFIAGSGGVFEGNYVLTLFQAWEHEPRAPLTDKFFDQMEKLGIEPVELTYQGWIAAHQFHTALKLAGPDFDREKLIAAMNSQSNYTAEGMNHPIDWTRQHGDPHEIENRGEFTCQNYVQIVDNEFVPALGEAGKPWVCFDARSEEWEEPTFRTFIEDGTTEGDETEE